VFGEAKPREAIIAQRTGKTEEEILKEAAKQEKLRVSRRQRLAHGSHVTLAASAAALQRPCRPRSCA
jgi:hypothetical protein